MDMDIISAETASRNPKLTIDSAYFPRPIDRDVFTSELNRLINFLDNRQNVPLAEDLNARVKFTGNSINSAKSLPFGNCWKLQFLPSKQW